MDTDFLPKEKQERGQGRGPGAIGKKMGGKKMGTGEMAER